MEEHDLLWRSSEERLTGTDGQVFFEFCESQVALEVGVVGGGRGGSAWMRIGENFKEGEPWSGF